MKATAKALCSPNTRQLLALKKGAYLYRAVDTEGDTIDFLLPPTRDRAAAAACLGKAIRPQGGLTQGKLRYDAIEFREFDQKFPLSILVLAVSR